jgi:DNA-binding FadR family transcriptional regulator
VGADAPAGLGPRTFDQYLEWGSPAAALLTEHRDLYEAVLARVPDQVRRHLLHALIW